MLFESNAALHLKYVEHIFFFANMIITDGVCLFSVHHFGRAVIMFGVPYVYTQSRILKVRNVCVCVCVLTMTILSPVLIHQLFTEHLEMSFPANAGPSGVRPGPLPDQRERLPHLRRHATRRPVCGPSHPRQDGLRAHDLRRQGG